MHTESAGDTSFWPKSGNKHLCQNLLSCFHGGNLWLDPLVSIDTQLITQIISFPTVGVYPKTLFSNKAREKVLSKAMKDKFNTFIGKMGMDVTNIRDDVVHFMT
jgi:hypothetical protein